MLGHARRREPPPTIWGNYSLTCGLKCSSTTQNVQRSLQAKINWYPPPPPPRRNQTGRAQKAPVLLFCFIQNNLSIRARKFNTKQLEYPARVQYNYISKAKIPNQHTKTVSAWHGNSANSGLTSTRTM